MGRRATSTARLVYGLATVSDMTVFAYDPAGAGRVVEVFGELDRAEHIAILVPGNDHRLDNYRAEAAGASPRGNGRRLWRTVQTLAPTTPTAVVVWLGYRPPKGFVAAARTAAAVAGARELRAMMERLSPNAHLTLIGHSYGSLVGGMAAEGKQVGDLVALASPGLGVGHVRGLSTTARVWAARADGDWVRFVPGVRVAGFGHGPQPTDPGFGAAVIRTDGSRGHSAYYAPNSETIRNLARIVLGRHDEVTRQAIHPSRRAAGSVDGERTMLGLLTRRG